jgi:poly(3-hydroxybutyrate) depolymerase
VPFIELASTDDPLLTIGPGQPPKTVDGLVQPTVDAVMATWRSLMGCRQLPARTVNGSLVATTWQHCDAGNRVGLALYRGGGHSWPRGDAMTPSAASVIWSFFTVTPGPPTQAGAPSGA